MYAIVAHSGKQYHVKPGLKFNVEKITETSGQEVKLDQVLLFHNGEKLHVGTPNVAGTVVLARVIEHGRGDKVKIIKLKRRKHHMKRQGHRQAYTRLEVLAIGDAKTVKAPKVAKVEKSTSSTDVKSKSTTAKPKASEKKVAKPVKNAAVKSEKAKPAAAKPAAAKPAKAKPAKAKSEAK